LGLTEYSKHGVFKAIPVGCHIQMLLDSDEIALGFHSCTEMKGWGLDPLPYLSLVQWREKKHLLGQAPEGLLATPKPKLAHGM
jgi:hypothetical protein